MRCEKLRNELQHHPKENMKSKWAPCLSTVLVTTRPDGSLQVSGAIFPSQNLHECCHNDDENGFSLWSEQCHFTEHIRAWEPPVVTFCQWMAEQQVNAARMGKAAARVLIIKEALHLSSCIVPSHDGHKLLDYPFQCRLGKTFICCPLIQRPSSKSLLSSKMHHCS